MSSLTRSEYRHEEQRRVTESPFRETKWDRHLDTLLTDLNESVGTGRSTSTSTTQQRALVPSSGPGLVTDSHGAPGSGDFHERREYTSPDQRTHVVEERFEKTARGDGGKPSGPFHETLTQPATHFQSSKTTYQLHSEPPPKRQTITPLGSPKQNTNHASTTETVREHRHYSTPHSATQYQERNPSSATKTESHYQTIRTVSEPMVATRQPQVIEYTEELIPVESQAKSQSRSTRTVTEWQQKSPPATYTYYEESPSVERRTARTVTQYRYPAVGSPPPEVPQRTQYIGGTEYPSAAPTSPVTVRYVDRKPITIYHDSRSVTGHELSSPPLSPPLSPRSDTGASTVVYERIIERQPIIHYYGGRPEEEHPTLTTARHFTLPAGQRLTTTIQNTEQLSPKPRSSATLPPGQLLSSATQTTQTTQTTETTQPAPGPTPSCPAAPGPQRGPPARSPELSTSQSVSKQVYKTSSYSSDPAAQQTQPAGQTQGDPSRFKQNILELDSLLDDLDHARKKPGTNGVDPVANTFDGPAGTSTPYRHTNVQKTTKTSRYVTSGPGTTERQPTPGDQLTTLGLTGPRHSPSPNPLDGLDRGLVPELSEPPAAGTTRVTKYEYRSSNRRDVSPQPQPVVAPQPAPVRAPPPETRTVVDRREYTSATNTLDRPQPPPETTDKTTTYVYNTEQTTAVPGVPPGVPAPPVPTGQPGSNTTINYHIYNYGTLGPDGQPVLPPGAPAPPGGPATLPRQEVVTSTSTTSREHQYRETSPPPARSPAPGPDTTVSNSYVFEKHTHNSAAPQRHPSGPGGPSGPPSGPTTPSGPSGPGGPNVLHSTTTTTKHYTIGPDGREIPARPASPYDQQYPKFPVDDGPGPQSHHTRTTTTTIERTQTRGSPFPARSPSPSGGRRQPRDDGPRVPFPGSPRRPVDDIDTPRRVDELMAQIPDTPQDGTYPRGPVRRELNNGRSQTATNTTHFTVHETEPLLDTQTQVTLDAKSGAVVPQTASKPVSGPPIYYPPGSTEFKPKPESEMMFQSYESREGGKYKSGYKAKGKYKAKAGSKETHAEGGAVIPICLPLCCGAACSVM